MLRRIGRRHAHLARPARTVKGNGEDGMISDGKPLADQEPNIAPADVKIIWETAAGLVKLETENGKTKLAKMAS